MIKTYKDFLSSLPAPGADQTAYDPKTHTLTHITHSTAFTLSMQEDFGLLFGILKDKTLLDGIGDYLDDTFLPGALSFEGEPISRGRVMSPVWANTNGHYVLSGLTKQGGITARVSAFTFDGGIVLMACDMRSDRDAENPLPIYQTTLCRSFAHEEKMKVYKNTVTHGGIIFRSLIDENHLLKHIRPCSLQPDSEPKRNLFTLAVHASPAVPCYAVEVTPVGMGFCCQILQNSPTCQAIILNSGEILSFSPENGTLSLF